TWLGTRGSEVQILSPRPSFSIAYTTHYPTTWLKPRCSGLLTRISAALRAYGRVHDHLQNRLQSLHLRQIGLLTKLFSRSFVYGSFIQGVNILGRCGRAPGIFTYRSGRLWRRRSRWRV